MSKFTKPEFKEQQLKQMQAYAEARGGKCLATEYLDSHTRYEWQDAEGNTWRAPWYNYKQKGGWSKKAGYEKNAKALIKYTPEIIQKQFADVKGGKLISTEYKNIKTRLEWQDSKGRTFFATLNNIINGQWSPHEKKETLSKLKRLYSLDFCHQYAAKFGGKCLSTNPDVHVKKVIEWQDRYGTIFDRKLEYVLKSGDLIAPQKSMGEFKIQQFLLENNIAFKQWDRKTLGNGRELDFFVPSLNLAIEYHGLYWHSEDKVGQKLHLEKYNSCKELGITLLQVFEHELKDNEEQVLSFLRSKLGLNSRKVFARKCFLAEVPKAEASKFLTDYHIQGSGRFKKAYGLYENGELLMLVAVGLHHRNSKDMVLTRCVSKTDVTVVGGLSKLCKAALNDFNELVTWVDLRWSDGASWQALGWKLEAQLKPDYFYYHENTKQIVAKQTRTKSRATPPEGMTEKDFAIQEGFVRIYDAGKLRLRLSK